ncbi:hypothetical protein NXY00_05195 [Bacteroides sp. BFG-551]|nr:hypothetical protein [Bacteroides sp. BFG-551]
MKKGIPKIDLSNDWIVYTNASRTLLEKYLKYPVSLKCEILFLCIKGEIEATININRIIAKPNNCGNTYTRKHTTTAQSGR